MYLDMAIRLGFFRGVIVCLIDTHRDLTLDAGAIPILCFEPNYDRNVLLQLSQSSVVRGRLLCGFIRVFLFLLMLFEFT